MNRFDIINRIGDKYRVGNTETGEFSYAQALKTVGKDIKDYQKATTGAQHKFLDFRFENERQRQSAILAGRTLKTAHVLFCSNSTFFIIVFFTFRKFDSILVLCMVFRIVFLW